MVTKMCEFRFMKSPESHNIISPKSGVELKGSKETQLGGEGKKPKGASHTPTHRERIAPQGLQGRAGHVQMLRRRFVADQSWAWPSFCFQNPSLLCLWKPLLFASSHIQTCCNKSNSKFDIDGNGPVGFFLAIRTCLTRKKLLFRLKEQLFFKLRLAVPYKGKK